MSDNKEKIIELFNDEDFEQMTDEQLVIQREVLNKKLNFPTKKKGQLNIRNESKKEILDRMQKNALFRKNVSCLISNYENKLKHMENTGEPMLIKLVDLKSSICFSTDVGVEGIFISKETIDELQKEGVEIIWN